MILQNNMKNIINNKFIIHFLKFFRRFLFLCLRNFDKITNKQNNNNYVLFFNFVNSLLLKKQKIFFMNGAFYLKSNNKDKNLWMFSQKKIGTMAYRDGLDKRKELLKKVYLLKNITYEEHDTIIDCGANNGDFYLCFNKKINYIGIEPSPSVFNNLKHNIKNQKLINKGLWYKDIKKDFYLSDNFGDSSIIEFNNFEKKIQIECCTLDSIISNKDKVKLIKIEAEGAEPEVLFGLKNEINKVEYIVIDVGFERGKDQLSTFMECTNHLLKNNFEIIDFRLNRFTVMYKNISFKQLNL